MTRILAILVAIVVVSVSPAMAMNVDDILELCRAGFEPDRIARIVSTTGLDQPLEASDWVRLKTECNEQVVDELLAVLTSAEVEDDGEEGTTYESGDDDVDINVYGAWGTNGWYGSLFWGGYSPGWGASWGWYDPFWHWSSWYWYDPWWCYPYSYHSAYYCHNWSSPYYYCDGYYTGGYYNGGYYSREKASRQGGTSKAYRYASAKASPEIAQATYTAAKAKPYRGSLSTGSSSSGSTAYRKSTRTAVTTADGPTVVKSKSYSKTTRSTSGVSTGAVKKDGSSARTYSGYAKSKTRVTHGGVSTGSGSSSTVTRSKTRVKSSTSSTGSGTTVKRKSSGSTSTGNSAPRVAPSGGSKYHAPTYRAPSMSAPRSTAAPRSSGGHSGGARAKGRH